MYVCSILHGVNSMYGLIVDSNWMDIIMVVVEDNISKPRTIGMCLNWIMTWHQSLCKELDARHMIEYCGAPKP